LLTNDGELARRLELPATGLGAALSRTGAWHGRGERLEPLAKGSPSTASAYGEIRARLDRQQGDNAWLTISLAEGRTARSARQRASRWRVNRLIRLSFGPFQLGHLEAGAVEEVTGQGAARAARRSRAAKARRGPARPSAAMRIVGARHRDGRIRVPPGHDVRPTADRAREGAVSTYLWHADFGGDGTSPISDARVLDAFAGSGRSASRRCRAARRG